MLSASPTVAHVDAAGMLQRSALLRPDIALDFDLELELTNFAPDERRPQLHLWMSYFQEQTARTCELEVAGKRTKRHNVALMVNAPLMPADCCIDLDLVTLVPNPDIPGVDGYVMSGYTSFLVSDLARLKAGDSLQADVSIGGDEYTKAVVHLTMRTKPALRCPVVGHPLLDRENLKQLFKKFKWAGLSMFDNNDSHGIRPLRDVCRRTHVLSWRTRWGHLPTEFFFVDNTRNCGRPGEAFFARLLNEAVAARPWTRAELLEVAKLQLVDRRDSGDYDERFHRLVLVFATMLQLVMNSAAYITDLWYRASGRVEERDSYDDLLARRGNGDCEEFPRVMCWLVCWLRKLERIRDPLLAYAQMLADLYVEMGVDGNVSANKAGNNAHSSGDDFGAHMFGLLVPVVKFEELVHRGSKYRDFRLPRYGAGTRYPWERRLRIAVLEGTSRVFPFFEPIGQLFPDLRRGEDLASKALRTLRGLDPKLFGEVFTRESHHGRDTYHYDRARFERDWAGSLYGFYRTVNEGYSGYMIELGGRLGRWAFVTKVSGDWRYGVPIEALIFDDPNVAVMFQMPLTEAVLCATKIALEHVRRTPVVTPEGPTKTYEAAEAAVKGAARKSGAAASFLDLYTEPRMVPDAQALARALEKASREAWFIGAEMHTMRFFDGFECARLRMRLAQ